MPYLVVVQILCGFFSAYVAGRKGRSRVAWWFIGALLPVAGVVLALLAGDKERSEGSAAAVTHAPSEAALRRRRRPKRCCGSYIPDCLGCPYFRRPLFSQNPRPNLRGTCQYFGIDLVQESGSRRRPSEMTVEER